MTLLDDGSEVEVPDPSDAPSPPRTRAAAELRRRRQRRRQRLIALAPLSLVAIAVGFNLFTLRTEIRPVAGVNDIGTHAAMIDFLQHRISAGGLLFDSWYPRLALGFPQFHHYSALPHFIAAVIALGLGTNRTVDWSNYLLLSLWPISVYLAVRLFGFKRWTAAATALVSPLVSSVTLYGYEHGSYVWLGNGVWAQLWAMWLLPLTLAFTWRAVSRGKGYALAALFLAVTIECHLFTGYIAIIALGVWVVITPREFLRRLGRSVIIGIGAALTAAWLLVPMLSDTKYASRFEAQDGTFWANSWGHRKVLGWLISGELFDHGRWPVLSILVAVGALVCIWRFRRDERARALLVFTLIGLLMFCGRDTVGFIVNRLPGGQDLLLHRFIIGLHMGGIMLAGVGASFLGHRLFEQIVKLPRPRVPVVVAVGSVVVIGLVALAPAWRERAHYDAADAAGINFQRQADATDGRDFTTLADKAAALGGGRVYAGSGANGGGKFRIGEVPAYIYLLDDNVDAVGFTLRELSLSSDVEVYFNDTNLAQYNLFNVRYVIAPSDQPPTVAKTFVAGAGRWRLWQIPTSGYLQVVDTTAAISADRTNMGARMAPFLESNGPADGYIPTVAFAGSTAATPTAPFAKPAGSPGAVTVQYDLPDNGEFGGEVTVNRNAVVMLKSTYDPRWHVTVDGKPAQTQMLAPSYVGVAVGPGQHRIEFRYVPYDYYWLLILVGVLTLVALALLPRYGSRMVTRARERIKR